jgi:hypothetical protein
MVRGDLIGGSLVLFVLLVAFRYAVVRALKPVRAFLDAGPWGDALAYFLQVQYYRRHSGAEPDTRCLFRGNSLHTPSWYHRFALALCSDDTLWSKPWIPNLVLYAIGVASLLLLSVPLLRGAPLEAFALLALAFLAQADNSRFDGRTAHYLTIQPRLLGVVSLSAYAALFAVAPSQLLTMAGGSLALLIALNTSVFSRQVAYFISPLAALLAWSPVPILELALATALSLLLNRTEFTDSFAAHVRYARWYFKNFYTPREGAGLAYLIRRTFSPPARFLPLYADSLVALVLAILASRHADPFAARAAAMIGAALIVCGATAVRRLASLGECWRYLSFTCWMLTPLVIVHGVLVLHVPLALACALAAVVLAGNLYASMRAGAALSNPNEEIAGLLRGTFEKGAAPAVWWSVHYRYGSIPVAMGYGAATFEIQGTDLSEEVMASLFMKYPFLHLSEQFFDRHRVTHLLISKLEWPAELYGSIEAALRRYRVLAENPNFMILAREGAAAS